MILLQRYCSSRGFRPPRVISSDYEPGFFCFLSSRFSSVRKKSKHLRRNCLIIYTNKSCGSAARHNAEIRSPHRPLPLDGVQACRSDGKNQPLRGRNVRKRAKRARRRERPKVV